jgi:hypothetical protein
MVLKRWLTHLQHGFDLIRAEVRQGYNHSPLLTVGLIGMLVAGLCVTVWQGISALPRHNSGTTMTTPTPKSTSPVADQFVTRQGAKLTLGGQPFRFTGFNVYHANSLGSCSATLGRGPGLDDAMKQWPNTDGAQTAGGTHTVMRAWFYQKLATTPNGTRDW